MADDKCPLCNKGTAFLSNTLWVRCNNPDCGLPLANWPAVRSRIEAGEADTRRLDELVQCIKDLETIIVRMSRCDNEEVRKEMLKHAMRIRMAAGVEPSSLLRVGYDWAENKGEV